MPLCAFRAGAIAPAALLMFLVASTPSWAYEKELADQAIAIAARLNQSQPQTKVAVVDFTDLQGKVTELGRFLAEELSSALAGAERKFAVIDRGHLRDILLEHKLGATGLIDPKTASQLGKIAGVRNLVGGTITQFQDSIRLSLKVFDSETADILYSNAFNIPKTEVLATLSGKDLQGPAPSSSQGTQSPAELRCSTNNVSFEGPNSRFQNSSGGYYGVDRSAFQIVVGHQGSGDKRCLDCRVKASTFRISATVWGDGKASAWGIYALDMSEVRGEWFSFEVEPGGRASIKHYRDGQSPATLWAGTYRSREKDRLTLEAKDGILAASANGTEVGRATYAPKSVPDKPLGAGFLILTGTQVPATVWFDDYELTTCAPES